MSYEIRFFAGASNEQILANLLEAAAASIRQRHADCGLMQPIGEEPVGWWTRSMTPNDPSSPATNEKGHK